MIAGNHLISFPPGKGIRLWLCLLWELFQDVGLPYGKWQNASLCEHSFHGLKIPHCFKDLALLFFVSVW